jgi:2-polyprenyl-6-methoxyphenol hydroxylase-like FAD-dependent oxidoreductase
VIGSKAICQQRDVLDVWDAVGVGAEVARRGVTWTTARTFHRDSELFSFQFADRGKSPFPPFVNISQCETERLLDERIAAEPLIEVRWGTRITGLAQERRARRDRSPARRRTATPEVRGSYARRLDGAPQRRPAVALG